MKRKNPSKAQLRRALERQQRLARGRHTEATQARSAMFAAERTRDAALQLIGELAPELLDLIVRPTYLPPDPGGSVVRRAPLRSYRALLRYMSPMEETRCIEHWITRMRFEIEANPEEFDGCRVLCFRMQRPKGKDSLAWQYAFDDRMLERSQIGLRYMIMRMAERLCDEMEGKIGGGHG